jgi:cytochrome c peroxidase
MNTPQTLRCLLAASLLTAFCNTLSGEVSAPSDRQLAVYQSAACALSVTKSADKQLLARRALGEKLFLDKGLSRGGQINCASCHQAEHFFSDPRAVSKGGDSLPGTRNSPSLLNVTKHAEMGWDGRRQSLEDQVLRAFTNPREHALPNMRIVEERIRADAEYRNSWASAFPESTVAGELSKGMACAMSEFVAALSVPETRFERYLAKGNALLSAEERQGLELFNGRARCSMCHTTADGLLTDNQFHMVGIGSRQIEQELPQIVRSAHSSSEPELDARISSDILLSHLGKFLKTKKPEDIGKFRTPSLRYVSKTAPYMHDGSVADLDSTLQHGLYYQTPSERGPAVLTPIERTYLLAFLKTL